jgi:hypothetical protein
METQPRPEGERSIDELLQAVPHWETLGEPEQERLRAMAGSLLEKGHPRSFIAAALRSTASVLGDLEAGADAAGEGFNREDVRRFLEETGAQNAETVRHPARREWKQVERERLLTHTTNLLREARGAHSRHEVKKTRQLLLRLDQRHLRRVLGAEGEEICNQIRGLLRELGSRF